MIRPLLAINTVERMLETRAAQPAEPTSTPARIDWQRRALEKGFEYVREPDDHYVECTQEQAIDLLSEVLGVAVYVDDASAPDAEPAPAAVPMTEEQAINLLGFGNDSVHLVRKVEQWHDIGAKEQL